MKETGQLSRLVAELRRLPAETPWVEFKVNNSDPQTIGDLLAALSNAAALKGKETAWVVWGVQDGSHGHHQVKFGRLRREMDGVLDGHFEGVAVPKVGGISSGVAL